MKMHSVLRIIHLLHTELNYLQEYNNYTLYGCLPLLKITVRTPACTLEACTFQYFIAHKEYITFCKK